MRWVKRLYGRSYDGRYDDQAYVNNENFWYEYLVEAASHINEPTSVVFDRYASKKLSRP